VKVILELVCIQLESWEWLWSLWHVVWPGGQIITKKLTKINPRSKTSSSPNNLDYYWKDLSKTWDLTLTLLRGRRTRHQRVCDVSALLINTPTESYGIRQSKNMKIIQYCNVFLWQNTLLFKSLAPVRIFLRNSYFYSARMQKKYQKWQ